MDCRTGLALFSPRDSFLWTVERDWRSSVREIRSYGCRTGLALFSPRDSFLWTVERDWRSSVREIRSYGL